MVDEEDLFCANCGTATPGTHTSAAGNQGLVATHNFACEGCGASMSYDAGARALRCPFCGSEKLSPQKDAKVYGAKKMVPFTIHEQDAGQLLRRWLANKFWAPSNLSTAAAVVGMTPVYVPYWVFSAHTFTYWTADSSDPPTSSASGWYPVSGQNRSVYNDLLVGASSVLSPQETGQITPFDLREAVPVGKINLENVVYEQYRVQPKYARHLAQRGLEQRESVICAKQVPGRARRMKVNVRTENLSAEGVLLPVWVMAYRYQNTVYRFLVNGQTGMSTGTSPISYWKIAAVVALIAGTAIFLLLGAAIASSRS